MRKKFDIDDILEKTIFGPGYKYRSTVIIKAFIIIQKFCDKLVVFSTYIPLQMISIEEQGQRQKLRPRLIRVYYEKT